MNRIIGVENPQLKKIREFRKQLDKEMEKENERRRKQKANDGGSSFVREAIEKRKKLENFLKEKLSKRVGKKTEGGDYFLRSSRSLIPQYDPFSIHKKRSRKRRREDDSFSKALIPYSNPDSSSLFSPPRKKKQKFNIPDEVISFSNDLVKQKSSSLPDAVFSDIIMERIQKPKKKREKPLAIEAPDVSLPNFAVADDLPIQPIPPAGDPPGGDPFPHLANIPNIILPQLPKQKDAEISSDLSWFGKIGDFVGKNKKNILFAINAADKVFNFVDNIHRKVSSERRRRTGGYY